MWSLVCLVLLFGAVHPIPLDVEDEEIDRASRQYPLGQYPWTSPRPTLVDLEPKIMDYPSDEIEGIIKITTSNGVIGTVCEHGVDHNAANVVCKMIAQLEGLDANFMTGEAVPHASREYGSAQGPIVVWQIDCAGNEHTLDACRRISTTPTYAYPTCPQAGVKCKIGNMLTLEGEKLAPGQSVVQSISQSYRLTGGVRQYQGRPLEGKVEVFHQGTWYSVCNDDFDNMDARVACRALGFMDGQAVPFAHRQYHKGTLPMLMDNLQCTGDEAALERCQHNGLGTHDCDPAYEVAGVICSPDRNPIEPLVSEPSQVRPAPQTARAPGYRFPSRTASGIAKRQFPYQESVLSGLASSRPVPPVAPYVPPQPAPPYVPLPPPQPASVYYPLPNQYVPTVRYLSGIYPLSVRLFGGLNEEMGMVQVQDAHKGYLTLCADGWDSDKAAAVCARLHYNMGSYMHDDDFGSLTEDGAVTLLDCDSYYGFDACLSGGPFTATTYCPSNKPATARCDNYNPPTTGDQQLAPYIRTVELIGPNPNEGLIYILNDDSYGTICDKGFDDVDAFIVCRELGFRTGVAVKDATSVYRRGMGQIWLKDVACSGLESHIAECPHSGYGMVSDCDHSKDAGVRCEY